MVAHLQAIRELAQEQLHGGDAGRGAVLLGLVGIAEREHLEQVTALRLALRDLLDYCDNGYETPRVVEAARKVLDGDRESGWMPLWDAASVAVMAYIGWSDNGWLAVDRAYLHDAMGELGQALAEHKAKWAVS